MRTHSEALRDLSSYFRQPLITSYLLSSERIAGVIGEGAQHRAARDAELRRVLDATLGIATGQLDKPAEEAITRPRPEPESSITIPDQARPASDAARSKRAGATGNGRRG
jgi:hypothetical protein